jgi:hypothetical protein
VRLGGEVVGAGGDSAAPVRLGAVVLLGPREGRQPAWERLGEVEALTALMPNTMHAQGASQQAAFRAAAAIARGVPVLRGTLPDDLAGLPAHAESLLRAATRASDA